MINRHTDRTDIYFISTYIWGSDSEHHLMNQLFRQRGSGTGTYEKKVGRPGGALLVGLQSIASGTSALSHSVPEARGRLGRIRSWRKEGRGEISLTCEGSYAVFSQPFGNLQTQPSCSSSKFKRKERRPRPQMDHVPKFSCYSFITQNLFFCKNGF